MSNINNIITQRLVDAYDYLNNNLFGGELPGAIISIDAWSNKGAYYVPQKFWNRKDNTAMDLIALGDDLVNSTEIKTLSALAHEMVHQAVFQKVGTIGHNREWTAYMRHLGLHPHIASNCYLTDSQKDYFADTDNVDHTIKAGYFIDAAHELIEIGWRWNLDLIKKY